MVEALQQFEGRTYLNLETRRRNGAAVPTPVWFVQDGQMLFIRTEATSGKVKRVRNDPRVRVAPCAADGALRGEWHAARASLVQDSEADRVHRLFLDKYGLPMRGFDLAVRLRRKQWATIAVTLDPG